MRHNSDHPDGKPYDIRERLFLFACDVVRTSQKLRTRQDEIASSLAIQLANAAVNAAANAEEADDGSSRRDFRAKERIVLRELKEARLRLRVLRNSELMDQSIDPLIKEVGELVRIVATILKNSERGMGPPSEGL